LDSENTSGSSWARIADTLRASGHRNHEMKHYTFAQIKMHIEAIAGREKSRIEVEAAANIAASLGGRMEQALSTSGVFDG
jgi:hypothetical protein